MTVEDAGVVMRRRVRVMMSLTQCVDEETEGV
jgi:hypothetical protein